DLPPVDGVIGPDVRGPYGQSLEMAKYVTETAIMPAVAGNKMGIVTFTLRGYPQYECTSDFEALKWVFAHWMHIDESPRYGSDFTSGLAEAIALLDRCDPHSLHQKVIVLFSDGGFAGNQQTLGEVIDKIKSEHIRLIVIGIGPDVPMPVPKYDIHGNFVNNI